MILLKVLYSTYIITPNHWIQYQSYTYSAPSQLPGEHSGQVPLQGRTHAKSSNNKISHHTGYPFIHLGRGFLLKDKECQALTGVEPATLWSRVKGTIQYTAAPPSRTRFNGTNGRVHFVTYFYILSLLQTFVPCFQFHAFSNICNQIGRSIYMSSPVWYYSSDQSHSKLIQIMKNYVDK